MSIDIWVIHSERKILATDYPGPPAAVCGFVSQEAKEAAVQRGFPTVSEIGFASDCHFTAEDWGEAQTIAEAKAKALGYRIKTEDRFMDSFLAEVNEDWEPEFDPEAFYDDWEPEPEYPEEEEE